MTPGSAPTGRPGVDLAVRDLGLISYQDALEIQDRLAAERRDGSGDDTLFLLEHHHVVTLGRNATDGNVLVPEDELARRGVELYDCGRGGDVTYHGPGQLVGYPVLLLPDGRRDVHAYVRDVEEALIRTLADFGIVAERNSGFPGAWVKGEKVAAIGIRFSRWVSSHGFALNVTTDLGYFQLITPCGLHGVGVTSMERLLGEAPPMTDVKKTVAKHFAEVFG